VDERAGGVRGGQRVDGAEFAFAAQPPCQLLGKLGAAVVSGSGCNASWRFSSTRIASDDRGRSAVAATARSNQRRSLSTGVAVT
jgi:hypothetical protein